MWSTFQRSLTSTTVFGGRPMSSHWAVMVLNSGERFNRTTTVLYPERGPAQTSWSPSILTFFAWTPRGSVHQKTNHMWKPCSWEPHRTRRICLPWFTAIASSLPMIAKVSLVKLLTSQPIRRGACKDGLEWSNLYIESSPRRKMMTESYVTLEAAQRLKCTMYSSLLIPPFPTSSMSGSIDVSRHIRRLAQKMMGSANHAGTYHSSRRALHAQRKLHSDLPSRSYWNIKKQHTLCHTGTSRRNENERPYLSHESFMSKVVLQLFPNVSAQRAGCMSPLNQREQEQSRSAKKGLFALLFSSILFLFYHSQRETKIGLPVLIRARVISGYLHWQFLFQWHTRNLTETQKREHLTASSVSNLHCYNCRTWDSQCPDTRIRRISKLIRIRENFSSWTMRAYPWSKSFSIFLLMTKRTWHRLTACSVPTIPDKSCFKNWQIETVMERWSGFIVSPDLPCVRVNTKFKPFAVNIIRESFDSRWKCRPFWHQITLEASMNDHESYKTLKRMPRSIYEQCTWYHIIN